MNDLHIFGRDILINKHSNFELSLSTTRRQSYDLSDTGCGSHSHW